MSILDRLVQSLRCLPGLGPKSAQRMVYYLLQRQRSVGLALAACLEEAMRTIIHCERCHNYTEKPLCSICQNPERDKTLLCVVEQPADANAIEQSGSFKGGYFVLMGKISPLDGIGPEDLPLNKLRDRILSEGVKEVILAFTASVEAQITGHVITNMFDGHDIVFTQLAQGIPSGGALDYFDETTIGSAVRHRVQILAS